MGNGFTAIVPSLACSGVTWTLSQFQPRPQSLNRNSAVLIADTVRLTRDLETHSPDSDGLKF
jgi:hypothetical protein